VQTLVITFRLVDMTDERYREVCAELAPAFAGLPGLVAKIWLADPASNTYGGVYLFADDDAVEAYISSTLYRTVGSYPHFGDLTVRRFTVDQALTRRTQPGLAVVAATPSAA
jgi:hypothetical protein